MDKTERIELMKTVCANRLPTDAIDWLIDNGFCTAPASAKFHGNYEGGLFDHSIAVMRELVKLTNDNNLVWRNNRSPYVVGLLHDVCKIDQYELITPDEPNERPLYRFVANTPLKGHGDKSVVIARSIMDLTSEEIACIQHHMGAFGTKDEARAFTAAVHHNSNVLWTHMADMLAAHVKGV